MLNSVNVLTSEVVYSIQGAGEYALSNREVLGFGGGPQATIRPSTVRSLIYRSERP